MLKAPTSGTLAVDAPPYKVKRLTMLDGRELAYDQGDGRLRIKLGRDLGPAKQAPKPAAAETAKSDAASKAATTADTADHADAGTVVSKDVDTIVVLELEPSSK